MTYPRLRRSALALAAVTALFVTGCGTSAPDLVRDPVPSTEALPAVDVTDRQIPSSFEGTQVVDPGWDTPPQYADGVYLAAGEREGFLEFTAVDIYGTVQWTAQRPTSCTDFVVTTDGQGRALAILSDTTDSDDAASTTLTAYDLTTGDEVWGPVPAPGPHQGPGLVFAASADVSDGARVALDPATGRVASDGASDSHVLGEHDGTLLLAEGEELVARDASDATELWRTALPGPATSAQAAGSSLDPAVATGLALVPTSGSAGTLVDLADGAVLSESARDAAVDLTTGTTVILDDAGLRALDRSGEPLWSLTVGPDTTITSLGSALLYLRDGGAVRVHNVMTGAVAQGYEPQGQGPIVIPAHFAPGGAAVLLDGDRHLLATISDGPALDDAAP